MSKYLATKWRKAFNDTVQRWEYATALKDASTKGSLRQWTRLLTDVVVQTCRSLGWSASARGHKLELLPVEQSEYLSLDVMAFGDEQKRWRFPKAVIELENS